MNEFENVLDVFNELFMLILQITSLLLHVQTSIQIYFTSNLVTKYDYFK